MAHAEVIGLFPTPFMRVPGVLPRTHVERLIDALERETTARNAKSDRLEHTAVIAPGASLLYAELHAAIVPALVEFGTLLFGEALRWSVKEVWMNALQHGGQQALHSHANSFISGIVYLSESHPSARTVFYRGLGGRDFAFSHESPAARQGPFNSPKWASPAPAPGDMVLFPSYLLHELPRNEGGPRLTLAFNAIPDRLRSHDYEVRFDHGRSQ